MSDPTNDALRAGRETPAEAAFRILQELKRLENEADQHRELGLLAYLIEMAQIEARRLYDRLPRSTGDRP